MAPVTDDDILLLQNFLRYPKSISPSLATLAVYRIVQEAATPAGVPKSVISVANSTLASLSTAASQSVITVLLSICELNRSSQVLDVFVLSSASWKAIVAACLAPSDTPYKPSIALDIISCAVKSASTMLLCGLSPKGHEHNDITMLSRFVKIAKFYCINASRCAKAFGNNLKLHGTSVDALSKMLCDVLQLVASVSYILLFDHFELRSVHEDIRKDIAPLVGTILQSVLEMSHFLTKEPTLEKWTCTMSEAIKQMTDVRNISPNVRANIPIFLLRVLAIIQLMKLSVNGIFHRNEKDQSQSLDRVSHALFCSVLLPGLFTCFNHAYAELTCLHERNSGVLFLDRVSAETAECVVHFRTEESILGRGNLTLWDFLLEQISSSNAVSAYVSKEAVMSLASYDADNPTWSDDCLTAILCCTRISLALESPHADTRWLPLATELTLHYVHAGKSVKGLVEESKKLNKLTIPFVFPQDRPITDDGLVLKLIARVCQQLCREEESESSINSKQPQSGQSISCRILNAFGMDHLKLVTLVKSSTLASTGDMKTCEDAIPLLPHLLDAKSACGASLACLRRESSSCKAIIAAINTLNPSTMLPTAIKSVCRTATSAIERHGLVVCPAVSAFVSRASHTLHESVSLTDWQDLASLLERCILATRKLTGMEAEVAGSLCGAVMYHASNVLAVTRSIPHARSGHTHATLPECILEEVELSLQKMQEWTSMGNGNGKRELEEEAGAIEAERKIGKRRRVEGKQEVGQVVLGIRRVREELMENFGTLFGGGDDVTGHDEIGKEITSLYMAMSCAARCVSERSPRHSIEK